MGRTPEAHGDTGQGTQFIADRPRETWQYKRQAEREAFIEKHIQKHSIIADE
jgi:catechol-2,3-dioxygenase